MKSMAREYILPTLFLNICIVFLCLVLYKQGYIFSFKILVSALWGPKVDVFDKIFAYNSKLMEEMFTICTFLGPGTSIMNNFAKSSEIVALGKENFGKK